jgi:hypothetical protein
MNKRERNRRRRARKRQRAKLKETTPEEGIPPIKGEAHPPLGKRYFSQTITAARLFWGAIAVAIALLGAWAILRPVVHVEPYVRLNPSSPFSERFKVSNDGYFTIYDVQYDCILLDAKTVGFEANSLHIVRGNRSNYLGEIGPGYSGTIDCPADEVISGGNNHYVSAKIVLGIEFTPSFDFRRKKRQFQFTGQLDSQGNVQWTY